MNTQHRTRTIVSSERGAALVMTLLVLVILTAFGLTLAALGMTEVAISSNWRDYSKDFYAAEAGLESGVVALRGLLSTTQPPLTASLTQAQLNGIATPPTLSDSRMTFSAYSMTPVSPAPSLQTFATGPYAGLFGWVQGYRIGAQVTGQGGTRANLTQVVQHTRVPLFQFGIFYGKGVDLEIRPGPAMSFNGKIFANSNIHIAAGTTLEISGTNPGDPGFVKTAGNIYRSIKSESDPSNYNHPQIRNAAGTLQTLDFDHTYKQGFGSTWSPSEWATKAMQTFGGQVQDSAMGVQEIVPPLPELFGNPINPDVVAHKLIEMPQPGDSAALASAKMYSQANVQIIDGAATGLMCSTVPNGAITTKTFYDARENKTMTTTDLDVNILRTNNCLPAKTVLYVAGTNMATNPVVRLVNGMQLPSEGMTVVSQNPVYIAGDYNTVPVGATHPPAAVMADAVTVLSNAWITNNYDTKGNQAFNKRLASATTVNAAIAGGPSSESTMNNDNGKANNLVRFLEDWTNKTFEYSGSLLALWHSQQATAPWKCCGAGNPYYYAPPNRVWGYDALFNTAQPPGAPMGTVVTKGPWSQS
jgi:type IV pilus assembly PilX-like protein